MHCQTRALGSSLPPLQMPDSCEGTLRIDGFIRRGTSETEWDQAEQVRRKWEAAGTEEWTSLPSPPNEPQADSRISIVAAVTAYLADAKARNLSEATLYKLKIIFEKQFVSWCAHKVYRVLEQVNFDALRQTGILNMVLLCLKRFNGKDTTTALFCYLPYKNQLLTA